MIDFGSAIDITLAMGPHLPVYPGDTPPVVRRLTSHAQGAPLTSSEIVLGCHLGTHVDAPAHFIGGGRSVDGLDLRHFYGPARVIEFTSDFTSNICLLTKTIAPRR